MKQKIIVNGNHFEFSTKKEESLLNLALRLKIPLSHSCGGMGTCGTCRVLIVKGEEDLTPPNELENELRQERHFLPSERLACQILVEPHFNLEIQIPQKIKVR